MRSRPPRTTGFTLVELLVVLAIIAVLMAVLMPAVQSSREAVRRIHCRNQIRQLGLALHNYHEIHNRFPAGSYIIGPSFRTMSGWGWGAMILPHVEQAPLYHQIDFNLGTAVASNQAVIATPVSFWQCPSDVGPDRMTIFPVGRPPLEIASGNYCGVNGLLSEMSSKRLADVTDGTSQTLLLGERVVDESVNGSLPHTAGWFGQVAYSDGYEYRSIPHMAAFHAFPINGSLSSAQHFSSRHTGGASFCFADGSVHFVSQHIDSQLLESLGTPAGGETIGSF